MIMEKHRLRESQYDVVLGPCPGCQLWQLDYTYEVASSFTSVGFNPGEQLDYSEALTVDSSAFYEAVEDALHEHLNECPHLQRALFDF